ncbi:MAG TPA: flippase [Candidatus Dormibacteraeota bacterium]|nr:flippase [Candidatus Dormibacteraeota bacterium]
MSDTAEGAAEQLGSRAVSNSLFILIARTVSRVISLVVVIVLANALGVNGYGQYTTLVVYSGLVAVIGDLGFQSLYTREAARDRQELGHFLGTLIVFRIALAFASAIVLGIALVVGTRGELAGLIVPGCALLIATAYASLLRNTFYAVGRAEFDAIAIVAETLIQAGLIVFGARQHAGVAYFVWAYAASYTFTIVYSLFVIQRFHLGRIRLSLDADLIRRWLPLALPFAFTFFLTNLYFRAGFVLLQQFRSFAEVGWFTLAYKPFEALQFVPLAIQTVVYPVLGVYFVSDQSKLRVSYQRFFKILVLLGWPLTVGTFVLVHPINQIFNRSGAFAQSEPALRILALGIVFLFANSAFYAMLNAINRQGLNAWATALAAAVNIALNLALIPLFGYLGASTVTVITEAALCTFGWWFVQLRRPDLRLPVIQISWRIVLAGVIMGAVLFPFRSHSIYLTVPAGFVIYLVAIIVLRVIDREEYEMAEESVLSRLQRNPTRVIVVGEDGKA